MILPGVFGKPAGAAPPTGYVSFMQSQSTFRWWRTLTSESEFPPAALDYGSITGGSTNDGLLTGWNTSPVRALSGQPGLVPDETGGQSVRILSNDSSYSTSGGFSSSSLTIPGFRNGKTISCIVQFPTVVSGVISAVTDPESVRTVLGWRDRVIYIPTNNTSSVFFGVFNGAIRSQTVAVNLNDGAAHLVSMSLDVNETRLYIDGARVGTVPYQTQDADGTFSGNRLVTWGMANFSGWPNGPGGGAFGFYDEFTLFNFAQNDAQAAAHYAATQLGA